MLVFIGCQVEAFKFDELSTMMERLVAHEMRKPIVLFWLFQDTLLLNIIGYGSVHKDVGKPANEGAHPAVPGK
jgi:hypothetical protein